MRLRQVFLILATLLGVSAPCFAEVILFYDDFEHGLTGTPLGNGDPIGVAGVPVGTWSINGGNEGGAFQWYRATYASNLPASVSGNYGMNIRATSTTPFDNTGLVRNSDANFAFPSQNNPAYRIRFEADIYGQNASSSSKPTDLKLALLSGTTECNSIVLQGSTTTALSKVLVGGTATALTWSVGTTVWHHVTVDYYPTASTFDLTIDAQTPLTGLAMTTPSGVSGFRFVQTSLGNNRWSVWDNVKVVSSVPEPSSIALLASALIGLVAYAWRKRR